MHGTLVDNLKKDSEEMRLLQQEWLILEITEHIANLMEKKGVRKKELAERLGRSKGYITQLLDGRTNMTLRTVADVMWALDSSLKVDVSPLAFESSFLSQSSLEPWAFSQVCATAQGDSDFLQFREAA
jgi:transcriptional regulator with XRE-family HTH domain